MRSQIYRLPETPAVGDRGTGPELRYLAEVELSSEQDGKFCTRDCTEMFFVTGGHGEFLVEGRTVPAAVNDVVVINEGTPHRELSREDNPLRYVVLGVERLTVLADMGGCTLLHLREQRVQLTTCMEMMVQEAEEQEEGWEQICRDLLGIILRRLNRRADFRLADGGGGAAPGKHTNRECELVRTYIDNHFKENLRLDELADLAHINKYYLSHAFQKEYNTSPISYLIARRIQESRYLLSDTDHTLSQIAHMLGFSSLSYFSQSFRRREGINPMEYRRRHRRKPEGEKEPE